MSGSSKGKAIDQPAPQDDHVESVRGVVARLDKAHTQATGALAQAIAAHEAALTAMETAKERDASSPDDAALDSAGLAMQRTKSRLDKTTAIHAESARALEGARAALTAATIEATRKELSERSTPDALATEIAAPWRVFLSAYAAISQASLEIGAALKDSHNASAQLRALGTYERDVDPLHAILPALDFLASNGVVADLDAVRPSQIDAASLVAFLDAHGKARPVPSTHLDGFRARLGRLRATRTAFEALTLEQEEARLRSVAAMASYRMPSRSQPVAHAPLAPTFVPVVTSNEPATARRSSAPGRRSGHDERE